MSLLFELGSRINGNLEKENAANPSLCTKLIKAQCCCIICFIKTECFVLLLKTVVNPADVILSEIEDIVDSIIVKFLIRN